jgi:2-keto-3-deoxy-L-rhamnonate aldolase RhmA
MTGTALSEANTTLPFKVAFFTITNKNAGATIVNVAITDGVDDILIVPQDLVLQEGDMLQEGDSNQIMDAGNQIKITSDADIDFFFTLENITP